MKEFGGCWKLNNSIKSYLAKYTVNSITLPYFAQDFWDSSRIILSISFAKDFLWKIFLAYSIIANPQGLKVNPLFNRFIKIINKLWTKKIVMPPFKTFKNVNKRSFNHNSKKNTYIHTYLDCYLLRTALDHSANVSFGPLLQPAEHFSFYQVQHFEDHYPLLYLLQILLKDKRRRKRYCLSSVTHFTWQKSKY